MDPLCISLVHKYLDSINSALADQFKKKYLPQKTNVELKEVLSKWKEEQLVRGLVYQHLKTVAPSLAVEFQERHSFSLETSKPLIKDIERKLLAIAKSREIVKIEDESGAKQDQKNDGQKITFATEEQLVRGLIFHHLKTVAPSLAVEFRNRSSCSLDPVPKHLIQELQKKVLAMANTRGINKVEEENGGKQEQNNSRKRLGGKQNTYTPEELERIKKAMANEEDVGTVAKEMGRTYKSVSVKIYTLRLSAGLKKGKFSAEEVERMKQALENSEDYRSVAAELGRTSNSVKTRMTTMMSHPEPLQKVKKSFTFEDDLLILDKIIPRLKFQKLSSAGFLSDSAWLELGKELQRNRASVRVHWEVILRPWLLQHYTGTTGFRIESMLTSLVAEKYNDHRGIDWSEIVSQHKEFVGHTSASISRIYRTVLAFAKRGKSDVSLKEVADYAALQEKREPAAKVVHREKIIVYFKERVAELGINVVV